MVANISEINTRYDKLRSTVPTVFLQNDIEFKSLLVDIFNQGELNSFLEVGSASKIDSVTNNCSSSKLEFTSS